MSSDLSASLKQIHDQGLYRNRKIIHSAQGTVIEYQGCTIINFCSNDYLGLANHPAVVSAFKQAADQYGVGSGSAHLVCGHSWVHHRLEEALADFTGREQALLFSTGYMANLGVISALVGRNQTVFEDRLNHASLLDGGLLSGAKFKRYPHGDVTMLDNKLEMSGRDSLIVTDGVFSMDGDLAPLKALAGIACKHQARLLVDDAHGFGVLGSKGGGVCQLLGLGQEDVPVLIGTLGKALGTFGAFVAGSEEVIETCIQKARTYIYTTALPPAVAAATLASLKIVVTETWRREKLAALSARFRLGAKQLGLQLMPSQSAIQPVLVGDSRVAMIISERLLKAGFLIGAIRPPTVPQGTARLRVTLSAMHEEHQIDQLLAALSKAVL